MKAYKHSKGAGKAVVIAALFCLTAPAFTLNAEGIPTDKLLKEASEAYTAGDYAAALTAYGDIESCALCSDELYYNIANCHFKLGNISKAILYYERCLKLNPAHRDALNNVALARERTLDKIEVVPDFILVQWINELKFSCSADGWAWISLALALVVVLLLLGFRHFPGIRARKVSFVFACIVFVLTLISGAFSLSEKADTLRRDSAIVMQGVSSVKSSPGDAGKSIFVLHEGTKVKVLDNLGEWTQIQISDGRQGWAKSEDIELI